MSHHSITLNGLEDTYPLSPWAEPSVAIVRMNMKPDCAHDEGHLLRVVRNALRFSEGKGDPDILIPAALLHDLVNVPKSDRENRKWASIHSGIRACSQMNLTHPFKDTYHRDMVNHAIEAHSFSAGIKPLTVEAKCVQDADRIDSLGLIGIARTFAVSGSMQRSLFDHFDPHAEHRDLDDYTYGLDHFRTKLFTLEDTMQTRIGKSMARSLTMRMKEFYDEIANEMRGDVFISPLDLESIS